jgi:hypothetical protein
MKIFKRLTLFFVLAFAMNFCNAVEFVWVANLPDNYAIDKDKIENRIQEKIESLKKNQQNHRFFNLKLEDNGDFSIMNPRSKVHSDILSLIIMQDTTDSGLYKITLCTHIAADKYNSVVKYNDCIINSKKLKDVQLVKND